MTPDISLRTRKRREREGMSAVLGQFDTRACREAGALIASELSGIDYWREARSVLVFLSMGHEIDTEPIISRAFADGKSVGIPRIHGAEIRFHRIPSLEIDWELHPFGVREPPADFPVIDPADPSSRPILVITPGLAFDRRRNRLGHGGGFYDRFFAVVSGKIVESAGNDITEQPESLPTTGSGLPPIGIVTGGSVVSIAVCASCQIIDEVPCDTHDRPVDLIMTEQGQL